MTTPECPKGPEREARPEEASSLRERLIAALMSASQARQDLSDAEGNEPDLTPEEWSNYLHTLNPRDAADAVLAEVSPEVERLAAEVERLRSELDAERDHYDTRLSELRAVKDALCPLFTDAEVDKLLIHPRELAPLVAAEVSRLREQLATAVLLPQDAEDQLRIAIADPGSRLPRIHYTPERASEPVTRWSARSVLDLLASWSAPVSESVPATPPDFGCLRIDLVSEWRSGDKALFRLHPDDEGEEVEVRKVAGSTALVEADPFPFGNPQRWSADVSELSQLPAPAPRCTAIVPTGPEDAMECGADPVKGTERCDGHTQAESLRASAPSEASTECKEQTENLHSVTEIQGNLPAAASDSEETWDPCECGGTCATPSSSTPPAGGDSDTTPRVWKDVRGCEWEEVALFDELRLIRTDPSHCREIGGVSFSRRYVEAHYGPLTEVLPCTEQEEK